MRIASLVALALLAFTVQAAELHGHVVSVADGDTLTLLVDNRQIRVRLADIDAPERRQDFGTRSRQSLAALCHGKEAIVASRGNDRYSRVIGQVSCAGVNANAEQVRRGMAWVYEKYAPTDSPLYPLQDRARSDKVGLWTMPAPTAPWEWRNQNRKNRPQI